MIPIVYIWHLKRGRLDNARVASPQRVFASGATVSDTTTSVAPKTYLETSCACGRNTFTMLASMPCGNAVPHVGDDRLAKCTSTFVREVGTWHLSLYGCPHAPSTTPRSQKHGRSLPSPFSVTHHAGSSLTSETKQSPSRWRLKATA